MKRAITLIAAASFVAAPLAATAAQTQPAVPEVPTAGVSQAETLPVLSQIPPGAYVVGGLVILAGVVIGIASSDNDDNTTSTTSTR